MALSQQQKLLAVARLGQLQDRQSRRRRSLADHQSGCGACGQETEAHGEGGEVKKVVVFCESGLKLMIRSAGADALLTDYEASMKAWGHGSTEPGAAGPGGIILPR